MAKPVTSLSGVGRELPPESIIFGQTAKMAALREQLGRIAPTNVPVLIEGESGSGKDVVAHYIHAVSRKQKGAFVRVHCPTAAQGKRRGTLDRLGERVVA